MGSKHGWTEVRIAELDTASLQQLLMNARSKDATDLVEMCEAELKKRAAVSFPPRKARTSPFRNREDQIAAEIGEFARKLAESPRLEPSGCKIIEHPPITAVMPFTSSKSVRIDFKNFFIAGSLNSDYNQCALK